MNFEVLLGETDMLEIKIPGFLLIKREGRNFVASISISNSRRQNF